MKWSDLRWERDDQWKIVGWNKKDLYKLLKVEIEGVG